MANDADARFNITAHDKTKAAFASVRGGLEKIRGGAAGVAGSFAGMVGVAGFGIMAKQAVDYGSALTDTAARMRIGVEELQGLQEASTRAGVANETLERGLRNVQQRTQAAIDGNQQYAAAIERLGLNQNELINMPLERKMEAVAKAYKNAANQNEAYRDVAVLLGEKAGPQLIEVLQRLGSEGFDQVMQSARDAGQVMSTETAQGLDKAADAIEAFKKRISVAIGTMIVDFQTDQGRKKLLYTFMEVAAKFGGSLVDAIWKGAQYVKVFFGAAFGWVGDKLKAVFTGDDVQGFVDRLAQGAGTVKGMDGNPFQSQADYWADLRANLPAIVSETTAAAADQIGAGSYVGTSSSSGSKSGSGISTSSFADLVRKAQDYAAKRAEAQREQANGLLASIEQNTRGAGVFV